MKRFHVHLSVSDLSTSIQFYSGLFGTQPTVIKDDYAKWMLDDPRINFAISQRGAPVGLNHLGFQVDSNEELEQLNQKLQGLQSEVIEEKDAACCYAKSDKYWINDPQGIAWEQFHTLDSIPVFGEKAADTQSNCCVPAVAIQPMKKATTSCCTPSTTNSSCC